MGGPNWWQWILVLFLPTLLVIGAVIEVVAFFLRCRDLRRWVTEKEPDWPHTPETDRVDRKAA